MLTRAPLASSTTIAVDAEGDFARSHVLAYEDLIAHTMATEFVRQAIYLVQQGASRDVSQTSDQKKAWNDGILKVESALDGSQQVINSRVAAEEQLIDRIQKIDQALASRAANRFAAASSFTTTYLPR